MRRVATLAAVALAAASAALADGQAGQLREVTMPGKLFAPDRLDVLVGDTVTWRNGDSGNHTVTANDDSFDSGYVAPGATFARTFAQSGSYAYHCSIHQFMRGVVNVYALVLSGPVRPVPSGGHVVLTGIAPVGTSQVVLQRLGGTPLEQARVVPAPDGSFAIRLRAAAPAVYRALAGAAASPRVRVAVFPRVRLTAARGTLAAVVSPARAGARAVLQAYGRERFDWTTVARGTVDAASRVRFSYLPAGTAPAHLRVVIRGGGGWSDGISQTVVVEH